MHFSEGDLCEEVYMEMSEGFRSQGKTKVYKLQKSLYGLKQASRQLNIKLTEALVGNGFIQNNHDYSLFTKRKDANIVVILVYVDDLLITGSCKDMIKYAKEALHMQAIQSKRLMRT